MAKYRVRKGQVLPQAGVELAEGTEVDLPIRVAAEFPHLVEAVTPLPDWQDDVEGAKAHELAEALEPKLSQAQLVLMSAQETLRDRQVLVQSAEQDVARCTKRVTDIKAAIQAARQRADEPKVERAAKSKAKPDVPAKE